MSDEFDPFEDTPPEPSSEPQSPEPLDAEQKSLPEPPSTPDDPDSPLTAFGIVQPAGARPKGERWLIPGCDLEMLPGSYCWSCKRRHAYSKPWQVPLSHEQAVARYGAPPEGLRPRVEAHVPSVNGPAPEFEIQSDYMQRKHGG